MDSLEGNKVLGAALGVLLFVMGAGLLVDMVRPASHGAAESHGAVAEAQPVQEAAPPSPVLGMLASANMDAGQAATRKCLGCHTVEKDGANKLGPALFDVVNRVIGDHAGFGYSAALQEDKAEGKLWDYANLDHFLRSPKDFAPGTKMTFGGIASDQERADMILYLRSLSDDPKPLPEGVVAAAATPAAEAPAAPAVPAGPRASFTAAQVAAGKDVYDARCAMCHGGNLEGTMGPALAGEYVFDRWEDAAEMYEYYQATMPMGAGGSLSDTQYTDIMAYILERSGFAPGDTALPDGDLAAMKTIVLDAAAADGPPPAPAAAEAPAAPAAEEEEEEVAEAPAEAAPAAEAPAAEAAPAAEGATTLAGVFTEAQAERGKAAYTANCALCHGNTLRGSNTAPAISGSTYNKQWIGKTVADLYTYIATNMPPGRGGALGSATYADITAYVLQVSKNPAGATELAGDPAQLNILIERADRPATPAAAPAAAAPAAPAAAAPAPTPVAEATPAPAAEAVPAAAGGATTLAGVFTEAQAERGKGIYTANCALCHGNTLRGSNTAPAISGSTYNKQWIGKTVGDLYTYIATNMPPGRGGSLGSAAYADLTAYILQVSKNPAGATELAGDPAQLNILIERAN